jgi:hypothetical protein
MQGHAERPRRGPRTRSVVIATMMLILGITSMSMAAAGSRKGDDRGKPSKTSSYTCRTQASGKACLRAGNQSTGRAFDFSTRGSRAGTITAGSGGDSRKPFTTNATGVATGLNADRVDGQSSADIVAQARAKDGLDADTVDGASAGDLRTRWALVDEQGNIVEQSGGFTVVSRPGINNQPATNPNVYISAGSSLVGKGLNATIGIQNRLDTTGDGVADPAFNGQIAVARCNTAAVACAPAGTNNDNTLVVRALVDNTNVTSAQRRFYVEVSE